MVKFYLRILWAAVTEFWDATDRTIAASAVFLFLLGLFNRKFAERIMTAWSGISPWWSMIPIGLFASYRVLRANYEAFRRLRIKLDESYSLLGLDGTLQADAFMLAGRIRNLIAEFIASNGEMPKILPTGDEGERMRMNAAVSNWCMRFTSLFRAALADDVLNLLRRIRAESVEVDFTVAGVLDQPTLTPSSMMLLSGLLMAAGLSLTLKSKKIIGQQE